MRTLAQPGVAAAQLSVRTGPRGVPGYVEALFLVALAALVLRVLALAYPADGAFPNRDSGVFLYAGWRILQGEVPYRDVWDHKPPAVLYADALGLLVGRGSGWGVWSLQLVAVAGAAGLGYALVRRRSGPLAAVLVSLAWVALLPWLVGNGNFAEEYALALQWLALWLFCRAEGRRRYTWEGYAIGAAGALAFLLRQNLVGVWLAIGLCLALRAARCRDWRALRPLGPMVLGGGGVVLAVLAYFAARGALADLWDVAFAANLAYARTTLAGRWRSVQAGLAIMPALVAPALAGWVVGLRQLLRGRPGQDVAGAMLLAVCVVDLPLEAALSGLSGRLYPHYYVAWLPVCALLAASTLAALERELRACWAGGLQRKERGLPGRRLVRTGAAAVVLPLIVVAQVAVLPAGDVWSPAERTAYAGVAEYMRETTGEDDTVLVWGLEGGINFAAGRRSPTRFVYQSPLFTMPGYQDERKVAEFLAGIEAAKPALIIDTSATEYSVPPLDAATRQQRLQGPHAYVLSPEMDEVFRYISTHYRPERTFAGLGWVAYRYAGPGDGSVESTLPSPLFCDTILNRAAVVQSRLCLRL